MRSRGAGGVGGATALPYRFHLRRDRCAAREPPTWPTESKIFWIVPSDLRIFGALAIERSDRSLSKDTGGRMERRGTRPRG